MVTERLREIARQVDALLDDADPDPDETGDADLPELLARIVAVVRAGGAELLDQATPHLLAYRQTVVDEVGVGEPPEQAPPLPEGGDVWDQVELPRPPTLARGEPPLAPSVCYLSFEGEVAWEPEHGLVLVFDHDGQLARADAYDDRPTLAAASGDPSLVGVIFRRG